MTDGRIIKYISPAVQRITGYRPQEFIDNPNLLIRIVHPKDRQRVLSRFEDEMKDPHPCAMKFRIVRKDGKERWVAYRSRAVFEDRGKIIGRVCTKRDITETNVALQELRKMASIVAQSTDSVGITDTEGKIEYVNSSFEKVTGYSLAELRGKNPRIVKSGEHSPEFYRELWDTISKGHVWRGSFINKRKNGENYYEDAIIFPIKDDSGKIVNYAKIAKEITKEWELEKSLREQETRLRTLINATPDIICFKDGQGRWLEANEADLRLFQLEGIDYRGKKDSELAKYSPFYYDAFMTCEQSDQVAWEKGTLSPGTEIIAKPDGTERVYDVIKVPLFNEDGSRKGLIVLGRDVTEIKETEKALRKSEKKYRELSRLYRLMADNIPDLVWAKDLNNRYLFANKSICAKLLMARDTEEPIGKDDLFFANRERQKHPERSDWHTFGEMFVNSDEIVKKTKKPQRFDEYGNVRGKFIYLDVYKAPLFDEQGNMIGTVGHGQIVTREKEVERKLKESEERYRRIFEESLDVIFITTPDGRILDINPAGLRLFGYSSLKEIQNINVFNELFHMNSEDRLLYQQKLESRGFVRDYELRLRRKDGSHLTVVVNSTAIFDENKNIIGIQAILHDITDKKRLEEQLAQAQKMEAVGTLAGGIAHDFNNLLTVINGYSKLALLRVPQGHPLQTEISQIYDAGKRAEALTSQLLAFSRKQVYKAEVIDINSVFGSLEKMARRLIDEDIHIDTVLGKHLPKIKADVSQIEQIFINLVVNARDALRALRRSGYQKRITIETAQAYLDREYVVKHQGAVEGRYVFFALSDNGIEMDEKTKRKIFEPFFTTKEKSEGTGLGLSTVYGIVKQNHGVINVYSEPGRGTTFKIYWPCTDEEIVPSEKNSNIRILQGDEHILIVEDDHQVRRFAREALVSLGYVVDEAANGLDALELIQKKNIRPDVIVTDLIMPKLGGFEFVKRIKKILPQVRVIYTSGYTEKHIVRNGMLKEGIDFIQKPYSIQELVSFVRAILDKRK